MAILALSKTGEKSNSPGHRFTEGALIIYTKLSIIYENGSKFACFEKTVFQA